MDSTVNNWSIIIFSYNEMLSVENTIQEALDFLRKRGEVLSEIIIVDDGSTDGSDMIFNNCVKANKNIRLFRHIKNLGIGSALKTGYMNAANELICAIPGDGQFDINELNKINTFNQDTIYLFNRIDKSYSIYRQVLSSLNKWMNKLLFGISFNDINWVKVYHKKQLKSIDMKLNSSMLESEICLKLFKKGFKFEEIPSTYHPRKGGSPKGGSLKILSQAINEIFMLYKVINSYTSQIDR